MEIKTLLLILFAVGETMAFVSNNTSKDLLKNIEESHALGMDCSVYSNTIESFINEYKQMYDSLTIACQLHLKVSADKLKSTIDLMVDQKVGEYLANVEMMKLKLIEIQKLTSLQSAEAVHQKYQDEISLMKQNFSTALNQTAENCNLLEINSKKHSNLKQELSDAVFLIRNGQFSAARKQVSEFGEIYLIKLITEVYNKNIIYAGQVIDFLDSFSRDEEIILGYRLLFDQIIKNKQIYDTLTTRIAYRVLVDFKYISPNNENMAYLRANIPDSLKNFQWNQTIVFRNPQLLKNINAHNDSASRYWHDSFRRNPFAYDSALPNNHNEKIILIPVSNGAYFHIQFKLYDEYLYADNDEFILDSERRAVFVWSKLNAAKETGRWQLEPIIGSLYFKIKNVYWNEYLTAAKEITIDGVPARNKLFTLRSGKCNDDFCKWTSLKYTGG